MKFSTSMQIRGIVAPLGPGDSYLEQRVRYRAAAKPNNQLNAGGKYPGDPVLVLPLVTLKGAGARFGQAQGWQRITAKRAAMIAAIDAAASVAAQEWIESRLIEHGGQSFRDMDQSTWSALMRRDPMP